MKHGSNFSCMRVVFVVRTALQLSEMCDEEEWLYPLPAKVVGVSCLPQGRQLRIVKHDSLLPGGSLQLVCVEEPEEKSCHLVCRASLHPDWEL